MTDSSRATRHMLKAADDGSIGDYDKWMSRGADICGTDKKGQNVLHFLVKQGKFTMLHHVMSSAPDVHQLVNKVDNKDWSPLHLCCIQHPVELRTLELLLTVGGDPYRENRCGNCKNLVDDDAKEFLHWRKRHNKGLPKDIRLLPNSYIIEYMRRFGHLDDDFTLTYDKMLAEGHVVTSDIQIIVTGSHGVGKTTLMYSLTGVKVKKTTQNPPKCIQMFPGRFTVEVESGSTEDHGEGTDYMTALQQFVDTVLRKKEDSGLTRSQTWLKRHLSIKSGQEPFLPKQKTKGSSMKATLSILDFSGDDAYQNIQHCFMTNHGIYILVFSLQQYPELDQVLDGVYKRLPYISHYHEDGHYPAVILVGTHLDKVPPSHAQISSEITEHLNGHPDAGKYAHKHVRGVFLVNNLDLLQEEKENIWQAVIAAAKHDPKWRSLVPARWLALSREVIRYRECGHKVMTFGNICTIAKEMSVPIQDDDELKDVIRFMHQQKTLLMCQKSSSITSRDPVVVDTQWLVNQLVELLKVKQPYVSPEFVESFLEPDNKQRLPRNSKSLMTAVSRLLLVAEPLPTKTENKASYYVVPCLLPPINTKLAWAILDQASKSSCLCFIATDNFFPPAFLDRLLATFISKFEVLFDPISRETLIYRHNACFRLNPSWNLAVQCSSSLVKLTLFSVTGSSVYDGIGNIIRQSVVDLFEEPTRFECHLYADGSRDNIVKVSTDGSFSQNTVPLTQDPSDDIAIWFGHCQEALELPSAGNSSNSKQHQELSPKQLSHVAKHIGNSCTVVWACLGIDATVVEQERLQHRHLDFRSQLTKILMRWRAMEKDRASLGKLIEVMKMNKLSYEEMLLEPVWTGEKETTKLRDKDAGLIPGIDLSSSPTSDDLAVIAEIVGSSYLVFFLELDLEYCDIHKAMELHQRQSEKALTLYLLELWGQRMGSKATFCRILGAMYETNLDTSQLKHINPRNSHC